MMEAKLQPRTSDAFVVVVTDDAGKRHRVEYYPSDSTVTADECEAKAIEYVKNRSTKLDG